MPITNQHRQEDLGQAYVSAVAAKAGFNLSYDKHDYGYDGTVKDVANRGGRFVNTGFGFDYQLKSSANVTFNAGCLVYDLESKNYNDLSTEEGLFPKVLILFVLPKDETEWLTVSQLIKAVYVYRDYRLEVEFRVSFEDFRRLCVGCEPNGGRITTVESA